MRQKRFNAPFRIEGEVEDFTVKGDFTFNTCLVSYPDGVTEKVGVVYVTIDVQGNTVKVPVYGHVEVSELDTLPKQAFKLVHGKMHGKTKLGLKRVN